MASVLHIIYASPYRRCFHISQITGVLADLDKIRVILVSLRLSKHRLEVRVNYVRFSLESAVSVKCET